MVAACGVRRAEVAAGTATAAAPAASGRAGVTGTDRAAKAEAADSVAAGPWAMIVDFGGMATALAELRAIAAELREVRADLAHNEEKHVLLEARRVALDRMLSERRLQFLALAEHGE